MLKIAKLNVVGVTKNKKYLVKPKDSKFYELTLDNREKAIRHKCLFY